MIRFGMKAQVDDKPREDKGSGDDNPKSSIFVFLLKLKKYIAECGNKKRKKKKRFFNLKYTQIDSC